ncbi:MAG: hypothetical protein AAGA30_00360 [Planctomycetota bacterium]
MSRRPKKSVLSYENFEDRKLLAGDVSVIENGHLFIRGDELSNQIEIVADQTGRISVSGLRGTTINGSAEPFRVSDSIDLNGQRGRNASFSGGLRIRTLGGDDRIDIRGIELGDSTRIVTGEGDDFVRFIRSTGRHNFVVTGGDGDDTLNFVQTRFLEGLDLKTNEGEDLIRVHNSRTRGSTSIQSGSDDDTVLINRVRFTGHSQRITTSDGSDQVHVRNNNVNETGLEVYAGDGRDHVFAQMNHANDIEGEILVAGQDGFDVLDLDIAEGMEEWLTESGFVRGGQVEGAWYVYDRPEGNLPTPQFSYWAAAVEFEQATEVRSIDWLGSYFSSEAPESDNFVIEIFESESIISTSGDYWYRQPKLDTAVRFEVGNDVNRLGTGEHWLDNSDLRNSTETEEIGFTRDVYSYSAEINFEFQSDTTYWVSIYSVTEVEPGQEHYGSDFDFGVLIDYPGEPGELRPYVPPTGTEQEPFQNTNASTFYYDDELGIDQSRWFFSSSAIETLFTLNV